MKNFFLFILLNIVAEDAFHQTDIRAVLLETFSRPWIKVGKVFVVTSRWCILGPSGVWDGNAGVTSSILPRRPSLFGASRYGARGVLGPSPFDWIVTVRINVN